MTLHSPQREAGRLAVRVMHGESPAGMPFIGYAKTKLIVNLTVARALGITTPPDVVARAGEVIGR